MRTLARALWLALLVAAVGCQALAQDSPAPPQGTKVHMHGVAAGYAADGYLFQPQGNGPFGAVLLIADDRGIEDYIRVQAQALADAGLVAVVIDLFRGQPPEAGNSTVPNNLADLSAALNFLHSLPNVRPGSFGLAGWGSGANYALRLARSDSSIAAVALTLPDPLQPADFAGIHAAILGNFGEKTAALQAISEQLRAHGCTVNFDFNPTVQARFYDPQDPSNFGAEQATRARSRIQKFFNNALSAQVQTH